MELNITRTTQENPEKPYYYELDEVPPKVERYENKKSAIIMVSAILAMVFVFWAAWGYRGNEWVGMVLIIFSCCLMLVILFWVVGSNDTTITIDGNYATYRNLTGHGNSKEEAIEDLKGKILKEYYD